MLFLKSHKLPLAVRSVLNLKHILDHGVRQSGACRHLHCLARGNMSWAHVHLCRGWARQQHSSRDEQPTSGDGSVHHTAPLVLKDPEFDLDFLLNPSNLVMIKENIEHRKGVGDIKLVHNIWEAYQSENDPTEKAELEKQLLAAVSNIPNMSHPESPIGDEDCARQVELLGTRKEFLFPPKLMVELGTALGLLRTQCLGPVTGNKTYFFIDQLAALEQALVRFTLDHLLSQGFQLISVPDLLNPQIVERCGFRTTGDVAQVYKLQPELHGDVCLAGTSEMALAGYFVNEVLDEQELPVKLAAVSRCYRAETSTMDDKDGIYRVHQFTKVEMFGVTRSDDHHGNDLLMELVEVEKYLFNKLGLHCRVLDMPTSELGAPAYRKFDIEAWLPSRGSWGEISSASNCTDYQSRRLNIKYRRDNGDTRHCTTVNGTACAVPRMIIALCETHQQEDGTVALPEALWEYMEGKTQLTRPDHIPHMEYINSPELYRTNY